MDKLKMMSMDKVQANIEKIRALFPNAVTEVLRDGKPTLAVDFDVLKQELADTLIDERELRYQFTWPDKQKAVLLANEPIDKTLRPCKEESVDFDTTQNLYIEGDNLEVLKLLQETYLGKIKMIYIDPPYNTGKDFVYNDDFAQDSDKYLESSGQFDERGNRLFQNTESNGRFHTDWLNMIYPRLTLAKDLLSDDGAIFISIDDNEVENLRKVCDEILGPDNFLAVVIHKNNSMKNQSKYIGVTSEYVVIYAKNIEYLKATTSEWRIRKKGTADVKRMFQTLKEQGLSIEEIREQILAMYSRPKYSHLGRWNKVDENGVFTDKDLSRANGYKDFTIINPDTGKPCLIPSRGWGKSKEELEALQEKGLIWYGDDTTPPREKSYLTDEADMVFDNYLYIDTSVDKKMLDSMFGAEVFEFPKPLEMITTFLQLCTKNNDIILDFFSGSATTAHAVMQLNAEDGGTRKFIMVQLPEVCDEKSEAYKAGYRNICEIGKERIRRAGAKIKEEKRKAKGQPTELDLYNQMLATNEPEQVHILRQNYEKAMEGLDIGFRVLKLDSSNMQPVFYHPEEYQQTLLDGMTDNIKADRTPFDLLFQVMLELGKPLSAKIEEKDIDGKHVFIVNDNDLIACFDSNVSEDTVKAIAQLKPLYAVFRDSSLSSDSTAANFDQIFATYSPATARKVL